MRLKLNPAAFVLLVLLTGCAALGISTPQSLDERLAYAQTIDTAVLAASTSALRAGQISADDHEHVIKIADQVKGLIDSARAIASTDSEGADAKLRLATAILTEIQSFLNSRKKGA